MFVYSISIPPDLPAGGQYQDKMDYTHSISADDIKEGYSSMHRRGWDDCLEELDHDWALDRAVLFPMQGYAWEARGYVNGYRACQAQAMTAVQKVGLEQAKQAVHEAVQARGTR